MKKPVKGKPVPKAKRPHAGRKPPPAPKPALHGGAIGGGSAAAAKPAKHARKAPHHAKAKHHPVRKLALGEGVACCSAEALAASLRLLGVPVSDGDVLALYWRTAADADAGASILATLETAFQFGLRGKQPRWAPATEPLAACGLIGAHRNAIRGGAAEETGHGLILGISDPAPHAVLATPDGWWSWGELYEPWTDDIDEAWEVTWPGTR